MITAHSTDAVRHAEAAAMASLPGDDGGLMMRAAAALAHVVATELRIRGGVYGQRVVLLVGAGNNGGDALYAGARLAQRGAAVTAALAAASAHPGALAAARAAGVRVLDHDSRGSAAAAAVRDADVVVDGLLGTGGRPGLSPAAADLVAVIPPSALVVAVDLPSGVAADSGELAREVAGDASDAAHAPSDVPTHVWADLTVTFGTAKTALLVPPAAAAAGRVVVADIGLDPGVLGAPRIEQLEARDAADLWPVPGREADKYSRGVLGVVAGGNTYTGAALLCTGAAVRAGAGMVRYVGPARPRELVRQHFPEVVPGVGRVQAWAAGPGIDPDDPDQAGPVRDALAAALGDGIPALLDAGALPALAAHVKEHGRVDPSSTRLLLTPHAGELARLLSSLAPQGSQDAGACDVVTRAQVQQRPLHHALAAVAATGATVLLKGATTLVVAPDGRVRAQTDGPGWLGTAGAGDVLAGIAGVLLAAGLHPLDAGSLATAVHGRAAALASGGGPLHAEAVAAAVPEVVAHLLTHREWPS